MFFFQYDPDSKRQSMHWKSPDSPRIEYVKVRPLTRSTTRRFWQTFVKGWEEEEEEEEEEE